MPIILKAQKREELSKKNKILRTKGLIPAVLYGKKFDNVNLKISAKEFLDAYKQAGTSTLIDLEIGEEKPIKVIITDTQRDPVKSNIIHIDFKQINMQEEITADVNLVFIGESPVVKESGGVVLKNMESVSVKCLPGDLPHSLQVDLSKLAVVDSHFAIKDLEVGGKVKILNNPEDVIVLVKAMKVEEEPVAQATVADVKAEGAKEGEKKEGAEGGAAKKADNKK
ncbi:MAG: 50S ribosomal protein L25 [bacterium]